MNIKQKLQEIINQSILENQDKELWNKFVEVATDDELGDIFEFLSNEPEQLNFLTKNLKGKLEAILAKDSDKLNAIIDEEIEAINNI